MRGLWGTGERVGECVSDYSIYSTNLFFSLPLPSPPLHSLLSPLLFFPFPSYPLPLIVLPLSSCFLPSLPSLPLFPPQEEYYVTHQCFLSARSLYLVVWNTTKGEAGVNALGPWLHNIQVRVDEEENGMVGGRRGEEVGGEEWRRSLTELAATHHWLHVSL